MRSSKILRKIEKIKKIFLMCLTLNILISQMAPTLAECMLTDKIVVDLNFSNEAQWQQVTENDAIYFESKYSSSTEEEIFTNELTLNKGDVLYFDLGMDNSASNSELKFLVNDTLYDTLSTIAVNNTYKYSVLEDGPYVFKWIHTSERDLTNDKLHIGNVYVQPQEGATLPEGYKSGVFLPWQYSNGSLYFSKEDLASSVSWLEKTVAMSEGDILSFEYFVDAANLENNSTEFFINDNKIADINSIGNWKTVSYNVTETGNFKLKWINSCTNDDTNDYKVGVRNLKVTKFYKAESKGHWYFSNPNDNYRVNAGIKIAFEPLAQKLDFSVDSVDYDYAYQNILPTISLWPAIDSFGSMEISPTDGNSMTSKAEVRLHLTGNEFTNEDVMLISKHISIWRTSGGLSTQINFSINVDGEIIFETDGFGIFTIAVAAGKHTDENNTDFEVKAVDSGDTVWIESEEDGTILDSLILSADTVLASEKAQYEQLMDGFDEAIKKDTQAIVVHEITATDGLGHKIRVFRRDFDLYIEKPLNWDNDNGFILYINVDGKDEILETDEYIDPIDNKVYLHARINHFSPYAVVSPKTSSVSSENLESAKTGDKPISLLFYNMFLISGLISLIAIKKPAKKSQ